MPKFESSNTYSIPAGDLFNAAARAVQSLPGWTVREVNPQGWYITAGVSFNFWSYGENISIQVSEPSPGQPLLTATSSSVFALFDLGKNRRNIEKLFAEVQNVITQFKGAPAGAPDQRQPDPPPESSCGDCGGPLGPDVKFCPSCGTRVAGT